MLLELEEESAKFGHNLTTFGKMSSNVANKTNVANVIK